LPEKYILPLKIKVYDTGRHFNFSYLFSGYESSEEMLGDRDKRMRLLYSGEIGKLEAALRLTISILEKKLDCPERRFLPGLRNSLVVLEAMDFVIEN